MKRVGSVLGVIALVTALVTAVPAMGLPYLFIRFIFRYSDVPISPVSWLVCSICYTVSVMCLLAFLFLCFSGRLGKKSLFRRYLPAWIAIGLIGVSSLALLLFLLYNAFIAVGLSTFGVF